MVKLSISIILIFAFWFQDALTQANNPDAVFWSFNIVLERPSRIFGPNFDAFANLEAAVDYITFATELTTITNPCENVMSQSLPCDVESATCETVNSQMGLFRCRCNPGFNQTASFETFEGNGTVIPEGTFCPDLNECENDPLLCGEIDSGICSNLVGNYSCVCYDGYFLSTSNICEDVDECSNQRICGNFGSGKCSNFPGSYNCTCSLGFILNETTSTCQDADECNDPSISNICGGIEAGNCTNLLGSYECSCNPGYFLHEEQTCLKSGDEQCVRYCGEGGTCYYDVDSSQECLCESGFNQNENGSCVDTNECILNAFLCGISGAGNCTNLPGSYSCDCNGGFEPKENTTGCEDIDECSENPKICGPSNAGNCQNTNGSFHCNCYSGYMLFENNTCIELEEPFCYDFLATVNSIIDWNQTLFEDGLTVIVDRIIENRTRRTFANFSSTIQDVLLGATETHYVINTCFINTTISPQAFSNFLYEFNVTAELEGQIVVFTDFDECSSGYAKCRDIDVCEDTLGGYRCVEDLKYRETALKILNCYYTPLLGISNFLECLEVKFAFLKEILNLDSLFKI